MPFSANAIANYFIDLAAEGGGRGLSPMKLQKLVYFAHGWHLGLIGNPLVFEQVQAWPYGPVIPSLYHRLKLFGSDSVVGAIVEDIPARIDDGTWILVEEKDEIPAGPEGSQARQILDQVWAIYGKYTATQLSNLTHYEGSPWKQVYDQYDGNPPKGTEIPNDMIRDYFRELGERNAQKKAADASC